MFPYDWRKDLGRSSAALGERVRQMHSDNGGRPVHLVGHSMGGLMIRTALRDDPSLWDVVGKVVFIGTPHFGSPAITTYLKNHFWGVELFAVLGLFLSRATFRSMWGALSMLPAPVGLYPGTTTEQRPDEHPTANFDHYDAGCLRPRPRRHRAGAAADDPRPRPRQLAVASPRCRVASASSTG